MGGSSFEGLDVPASEGSYGPKTFDNTGEAELVLPIGEISGSILIQSHPENDDNIFLGFDDEVTAANGIVLEPSDFISIDMNNSSLPLYATVLTVSDQIRFMIID